MATEKVFFPTLNAVRLIPLRHIDPFSTTKWLNFFENSKVYSQLPFLSVLDIQKPMVSEWPCTRCPSMRSSNLRLRSKLTRPPVFHSPMLDFESVSAIAVTE